MPLTRHPLDATKDTNALDALIAAGASAVKTETAKKLQPSPGRRTRGKEQQQGPVEVSVSMSSIRIR